jgi:hypothetical protein
VDWSLCLTRSGVGAELRAVTLGQPLLDDYLAFVGARARPNTWLATAYDLKVFFTVVAKEPTQVTTADVFAFIRRSAAHAATRRSSGLRMASRGWPRARSSGGWPASGACLPIWWLAEMWAWPPIRCPEGWPPGAPRPDPARAVSP